jgi:hypothetical protein
VVAEIQSRKDEPGGDLIEKKDHDPDVDVNSHHNVTFSMMQEQSLFQTFHSNFLIKRFLLCLQNMGKLCMFRSYIINKYRNIEIPRNEGA